MKKIVSIVFVFAIFFAGSPLTAQDRKGPDPDTLFSSPIKLGMITEEVRDVLGPPYYVVGSHDPNYIHRRYKQLMEHNTMFDIWLYKEPYNFMIYFMNGRVLKVVYIGGSSAASSPSLRDIYSEPLD